MSPVADAEKPANFTPSPPPSAHRTQSPAGVSGKRELFNEWPETFGIFGRLLRKPGVRRPPTELQKPASGGLFCDGLRPNREQTGRLAGARGFELTHSRSNPVFARHSRHLGILQSCIRSLNGNWTSFLGVPKSAPCRQFLEIERLPIGGDRADSATSEFRL
jgi:hypothetical protein